MSTRGSTPTRRRACSTCARSYDPATGQFLTRDPLESQTTQPYSYADDNPLALSDPSGLASFGPGQEPSPIDPTQCVGALTWLALEWGVTHPPEAQRLAQLGRETEVRTEQWMATTPSGHLFEQMVLQPICTLEYSHDWHAKARAALDLAMLFGGGELGDLGALGDAGDTAAAAGNGLREGAADATGGADTNAAARGGDASLAPAKRATGQTVLGHYPAYVKLSDEIGARRYQIPDAVWNKMTDAERWAANRRFLDRTIQHGDEIILATRIDQVKPGSYFAKELEYLFSRGYRVSEDGTRLVPGG